MCLSIAFRVDASVQIGTGHVMRCLTLADELRRQGHRCRFICRDHQGHLADHISSKGYELHLLTISQESEREVFEEIANAHAEWLSVPWQLDAEQTLEVVSSLKADWLVVDHYALDARWENRIASAIGRIMVIDDLADRAHQSDLLLDQNVLRAQVEKRYGDQVGTSCKLLMGPRYALLGEEYRCLSDASQDRDGLISRVLVFVGGSDPFHLTEQYLEALSAPAFENLQVDVVIGKNHPKPEVVKKMVSRRNRTKLYSNLPSLAALMVKADIMLGAGGATNWERMCLGLTSIVVSVAHNQDDINRDLADREVIHFLGKAENISIEHIKVAMRSVLSNASKNSAQSKTMRKLVDGRGAERVAKVMVEMTAHVTA